jgi:hypothetical protein
MAQRFSGDWTVEWANRPSPAGPGLGDFLDVRFVIEGSRASDGGYAAPLGAAVAAVSVGGSEWFVKFEYLSGNDWVPNPWPARRTSATYTLEDGLVVLLATRYLANLLPLPGKDIPGGDIVLSCRNVEPVLNPWRPFKRPYEFILPRPL